MHGVSQARALAGAIDDTGRVVFARCGYLEGFVAIDERWCYEETTPWLSEDRALVVSWYGGPIDKTPRRVLHDRRADRSPAHARSALIDQSIVDPLRAAAAEWNARIDQLRERLHTADWIDRFQSPAQPAPAKNGQSTEAK
jgi:hypothetical protein